MLLHVNDSTPVAIHLYGDASDGDA